MIDLVELIQEQHKMVGRQHGEICNPCDVVWPCAAIRTAKEIERLREALRELIRWCKTYMEYHGRKYAENDMTPPTGLWPAIKAAEAAIHTEDAPGPKRAPSPKWGGKC